MLKLLNISGFSSNYKILKLCLVEIPKRFQLKATKGKILIWIVGIYVIVLTVTKYRYRPIYSVLPIIYLLFNSIISYYLFK